MEGHRHLGPRPLRDGVAEQHALRREPRQHRGGLAPVAVGVEVVAPQRVAQEDDDTLRRPRPAVGERGPRRARVLVPGGRRSAVPHHRRAPEAEQAVVGAVERQLQAHRPPGMVAEIEPARLPAVRQGHRPPPEGGAVDGHVERDRLGLDRPDRDVQPGAVGQVEIESDALRRPADDRLAVDLPQPLPAGPGGHRPEVLGTRDEPHRLDLERGPRLVGRLHEQVPDAGDGKRPRDVLQGVGLDLVARLEIREQRRRRGAADAPQDALLVELARAVERHADAGPGGDAHRDLDGVQQVALVELLGPRGVQQGQLPRCPRQAPVPNLQVVDVVVGRPADGGGAVFEVLRLLFIVGRLGGGERPLAVEAPLGPLERPRPRRSARWWRRRRDRAAGARPAPARPRTTRRAPPRRLRPPGSIGACRVPPEAGPPFVASGSARRPTRPSGIEGGSGSPNASTAKLCRHRSVGAVLRRSLLSESYQPAAGRRPARRRRLELAARSGAS